MNSISVEKTRMPLALLIMLIGARFAVGSLILPENLMGILQKIFESLIILVITHVVVIILNIVIDNWGRKITAKTKSRMDDDLLTMFHRFVKVVLYLLGVMYALIKELEDVK